MLPRDAKHKLTLYTGLSLFLGLALGSFIGFKNSYKQSKLNEGDSYPISEQNSQYKLITPLLAYDEYKEFYAFQPLKNKIQNLIDQMQSSGKIDELGFYFRQGGHWVGINQDSNFYPASLMKVPLMIAYFKLAETQPEILSKKYTYDGKEDLNALEARKPEKTLAAGQSYSVLDLIKFMIEYSDNNATYILQHNIDQDAFHEIYTDLGISVPNSKTIGGTDYLSPKAYSLFLRVLRGSTYLNNQYSEQAMEILSQADFNNGIVAGVPQGTVVAHKFGEYTAPENDGSYSYQLHDCGYVFHPTRPYLLCIMAKSKKPDTLEESLKQISALVYQNVDSNYK